MAAACGHGCMLAGAERKRVDPCAFKGPFSRPEARPRVAVQRDRAPLEAASPSACRFRRLSMRAATMMRNDGAMPARLSRVRQLCAWDEP